MPIGSFEDLMSIMIVADERFLMACYGTSEASVGDVTFSGSISI
jgi:hypothetical protein